MYQFVHSISDLVRIQWALYMYLGTVAFVDIYIASSLCYLLATSRTGFSRTDLFITKLMNYVIDTGCLTSMCSMIAIITCAVMPKNYIFEAVEFLLLKLYVNSYLALLNVQYYVQPNADKSGFRHGVYHPKLHVNASQTRELRASRKSMFEHPDGEVMHITRPVQAVMPQRPMEVTMQMNSLPSV